MFHNIWKQQKYACVTTTLVMNSVSVSVCVCGGGGGGVHVCVCVCVCVRESESIICVFVCEHHLVNHICRPHLTRQHSSVRWNYPLTVNDCIWQHTSHRRLTKGDQVFKWFALKMLDSKIKVQMYIYHRKQQAKHPRKQPWLVQIFKDSTLNLPGSKKTPLQRVVPSQHPKRLQR